MATKRCGHERLVTGHLVTMLDTAEWYRKEIAVKRCATCGEWLSLGKANDRGVAALEILAVEIVAEGGPHLWYEEPASHVQEAFWLARQIATHDAVAAKESK